ncbi:MAG: 30S ribosome-binding factor RbfA [Clostridia bacterium]|nr:30S ribosome-binding factor RbfA [Clostridia bacterium]MBO4428604.1 30S ribosome-binding factor RbfA [Clostridia bacterium]
MAKYRRERINDEVTRVLAESLRNVKDPRISGELITVTQSRVTGDLKYAKIFFSVLGDTSPEKIKEIKKGLKSAEGFLRHCLAESINLRITPELSFEYDDSIENGAHIEQLIKDANIKPADESEGGNDD